MATFTVLPPNSCLDALKLRARIPSNQFHYRHCRLFMAGRYGLPNMDGYWWTLQTVCRLFQMATHCHFQILSGSYLLWPSIFWTWFTKRATTLPLWSSQIKGNLGGTDFPRLKSKKRAAGMVPDKRSLCWKWVWQPILFGYLRFQMAGIPFWKRIKELRRSVWYQVPEFLITHAFWTGCQLFSYRELHIGNVQICNKEKKISDFSSIRIPPFYTWGRFLSPYFQAVFP